MMMKRIFFALTVAGFMLLSAVVLKYAQANEIIGADAARRSIQVIIGLVLMVYGNFMPKDIAQSRAMACAASRSQSALRVGGWSMALAGLGYAGLWAFAPLAFANVASIVVVATAMFVTMGYGGWLLLTCRQTESNSSI
jgi:hypothetical protein